MKFFFAEGNEDVLIQLTPESREEDLALIRLGIRAKAIDGGSVETYSSESGIFAQICLPATKARYSLVLKQKGR